MVRYKVHYEPAAFLDPLYESTLDALKGRILRIAPDTTFYLHSARRHHLVVELPTAEAETLRDLDGILMVIEDQQFDID